MKTAIILLILVSQVRAASMRIPNSTPPDWKTLVSDVTASRQLSIETAHALAGYNGRRLPLRSLVNLDIELANLLGAHDSYFPNPEMATRHNAAQAAMQTDLEWFFPLLDADNPRNREILTELNMVAEPLLKQMKEEFPGGHKWTSFTKERMDYYEAAITPLLARMRRECVFMSLERAQEILSTLPPVE